MTDEIAANGYGVLTDPATLRIERLLPGPIDRVWAYLIRSDLRRQWFAAGEVAGTIGATFELTWRNDDLTDPPGARPKGYSAEHSMTSTLTAFEPPHRLGFTFGDYGLVAITLAVQGDEVLLTLVHNRLPDAGVVHNVAPGWHAHLDVLAARLGETKPEPFWDNFARLKREYDVRLSA